MSNWPLFGASGVAQALGIDAANSRGTQISPGTSYTKGTPVSLGTVTEKSESLLVSIASRGGFYGNAWAVDLMLDVGGTKDVVAPDLVYVSARDDMHYHPIQLPLSLPAGAALYARSAHGGSTSSWPCYVSVRTFAHGWMGAPGSRALDTLGVTTGGAGHVATAVSGHASANTKSAWTSLGTATGTWAATVLGLFSENASAMNSSECLVDLGVDPAGGTSFQVAVPDMQFMMDGSGDNYAPGYLHLPVRVPSGGSVGVRFASTVAAETIYACAHGALL